jgi:hypothetical protein
VLLRERVSPLDRETGRRALGVAELHVQVLVDAVPVGEVLGGQEALQGGGEGTLPDGAADGAADGSAGVAEDSQESEGAGGVLVVGSGEDGDLLGDDQGAAGEGEEDLAHDKVADGLVWLAEVDHEALAEHVEGHRNPNDPAVALGPLDGESDDEEPDAGDDVEDGGDVAGGLEGLAAVDLQEGGVVRDPAVVGDLVAYVEGAGPHDCARAHNFPLQKRYGSEELLAESEGDEAHYTENQHGDDTAIAPRVGEGSSEVEWEQKQDKAGEEKERAEDWKLRSVCSSCRKQCCEDEDSPSNSIT